MINDFTTKIKNYFNIGSQIDDSSKNKTIQSVDNLDEFKKEIFEENNQINTNKSINFKNQNMNNFTLNSYNYEDNIKSIMDENSNLFLEINQLSKEIDIYSNRLDELNNEYNKLKQNYRDKLVKNTSFEKIETEKDLEEEFVKLEEEKHKLKLNHLLDKNRILKDKNKAALIHNEKLKKYYKDFTGKYWK